MVAERAVLAGLCFLADLLRGVAWLWGWVRMEWLTGADAGRHAFVRSDVRRLGRGGR